jgi:integrase
MARLRTEPKKNKTGDYSAVVNLGPDPATGKSRYRRVTKPTRKEWHAEADKVRHEANTGTYVPPAKQTFGAFLDEWLATTEPARQPSTHASYARMVRVHVKPRVGALKLEAVTGETLTRLYRDLAMDGRHDGRGGLSARTVRYLHTVLQRALKDAVKWKRLQHNPAEAAEPPRANIDGREMQTLDGSELAALLERARGSRYRVLWLLAATTGMRRGEQLGLRWGDIDLTSGQVTIRRTVTLVDHTIRISARTKTGRGRSLRLDPGTLAELRAHRAWQGEELLRTGIRLDDATFVFCLPDARPYNPDRVSRELERFFDRHADLHRVRYHDLRHTSATLALAAGVPAKVVSERLGHANVGVTLDVYSHVTPKMDADAAAQIAAQIPGLGS